MSIAETQLARSAKLTSGPTEHGNPEQATKNREVARAVKIVNDGNGVGAGSELRFSIDTQSGSPLIKIVDRITNEVIQQIPAESVIRLAEVLKNLRPGDRLA
jgi:uncharacterized FlaG/YvyC family protein